MPSDAIAPKARAPQGPPPRPPAPRAPNGLKPAGFPDVSPQRTQRTQRPEGKKGSGPKIRSLSSSPSVSVSSVLSVVFSGFREKSKPFGALARVLPWLAPDCPGNVLRYLAMNRGNVRRFLAGHRAAAARAAQARAAEGPRPERAIRESLAALNALAEMGLWPGPRDARREDAVGRVRQRWVAVQRRAGQARQR
jgi:hypothetical protein